jgi:nitrogen fixation NifU-like protein
MITEMVRGMTLDEAMQVSRKDVADELEGLPPIKMHCSNLAADALHAAIAVWRGEAPPPREDALANLEGLMIEGENEYLGKGFYVFVDDLSMFAGKRVLVVYTGDKSVETAINLTEHTSRVVLSTPMKRVKTEDPELKKRLDQSDVKVIYESAVLAMEGLNEVEKVQMHNLAEDEKYELFVDAVVKLALDSNVSGGACELPPSD